MPSYVHGAASAGSLGGARRSHVDLPHLVLDLGAPAGGPRSARRLWPVDGPPGHGYRRRDCLVPLTTGLGTTTAAGCTDPRQ